MSAQTTCRALHKNSHIEFSINSQNKLMSNRYHRKHWLLYFMPRGRMIETHIKEDDERREKIV